MGQFSKQTPRQASVFHMEYAAFSPRPLTAQRSVRLMRLAVRPSFPPLEDGRMAVFLAARHTVALPA